MATGDRWRVRVGGLNFDLVQTKSESGQSAAGSLQASFRVISRWDRGFQGEFALCNRGQDAVEGWCLRLCPEWELLEVLNGSHRVEQDGSLLIEAGERAQVLPPGTTACISFIANGEPDGSGGLRCEGRRAASAPLSRREPVFRRRDRGAPAYEAAP